MTWQDPIGPPPWNPWPWQRQPQPYVPPATTTTWTRAAFDVFQWEIFEDSAKKKLHDKIKDRIDLNDLESLDRARSVAFEINDAFGVAGKLNERITELEDKVMTLEGAKWTLLEYLDEAEYNEKLFKLEEQLNDYKHRLKNMEKAMAGVMIEYGLLVQGYSGPRPNINVQANY